MIGRREELQSLAQTHAQTLIQLPFHANTLTKDIRTRTCTFTQEKTLLLTHLANIWRKHGQAPILLRKPHSLSRPCFMRTHDHPLLTVLWQLVEGASSKREQRLLCWKQKMSAKAIPLNAPACSIPPAVCSRQSGSVCAIFEVVSKKCEENS